MEKKPNQNISQKPKQEPSYLKNTRFLTEEELIAWGEEIKRDQARLKDLLKQEKEPMKKPEDSSTCSAMENQYPEPGEVWVIGDEVIAGLKPLEWESGETLHATVTLTSEGKTQIQQIPSQITERPCKNHRY